MVITRKALAEMIASEVRLRLRNLVEVSDGSPKKPKKPQTSSADQEDPPRGEGPGSPGATTGSPDVTMDSPDSEGQDDDPDGPAIDGDQPDPDAEEKAIDADGDEGEDASGAVNNDISGKTVQSISIEPKSKILPGAKEVIISFNETSDALRVLVTATGQVKFFLGGQLHDLP